MNEFIYLDAAATSLKPDCVIAAEMDFLKHKYANSGRGVCGLAAAVDNMLNLTRKAAAGFINAEPYQVVFTSGTTDSMNRIVNILQASDKKIEEVAVSDLDHHSARLPWENLARKNRVKISLCDLDSDLNISSAPTSDVLVITAMSNVMGMPQDVEKIIKQAREKNPNVITIVDAAQYVVHSEIDVKKWDCDFLCFSAHKIGADTGLGVMYIKNPESFLPDKFGGGMINRIVSQDEWVFNASPDIFEAGTLPLTQISGLVPAIDYLKSNRPNLDLIKYLYDELSRIKSIKILTKRDATLLSFVPENMHVLDFGALVGANKICLRVGNMCASWIHKRLNINGSVRVSIGFWNTKKDMDALISVIKSIVK